MTVYRAAVDMSTPLLKTDVPDDVNRLTYDVIGAAIDVHRALGPGQPERFYEDAMSVALTNRRVPFERQRRVALQFERVEVGTAIIDLVVGGKVVVELKSVEKIHPVHEAQVVSYLRLTRLPVGLLINFHEATARDGIRRYLAPRSTERAPRDGLRADAGEIGFAPSSLGPTGSSSDPSS